MEIFAHGLWASAAAVGVNRLAAKPIRVRWFAFWAIFPDLFAFVPETAVAVWYRAFGELRAHGHGHHLLGIELYDPSHSFVVLAPILFAVWLAWRRSVWPMLGWALHIAMDIPTHSAHFPTPFLWPLSSYRFIGISWRSWWFMGISYAALALVFLILYKTRRPAAAKASRETPLTAAEP